MKFSKSLQVIGTDVFYNYLSIGLTIIGGVFLLPFYLNYISKEGYGIWLSVGSSISMISIFGGGFDIVVLQRLTRAYARKNMLRIKREFSSGLYITIIFGILLISIGYILRYNIISWLNVPADKSSDALSVIYVSLMALVLQLIFFHIKTIPLAKLQPKKAGLMEVLGKGLSIVITILLVVLGYGFVSFAIAQLVFFFSALIGLLMIYRREVMTLISFDVPGRYYRSQLREYYPSIIGRSGSVIFNNLQIPFVSGIINPSVAASYGITKRLFDSLNMLLMPFTKAILPVLTNRLNNKVSNFNNRKFINYYTMFIVGIAFIIFITTVFSSQIITIWVGKDFFIGEILAALFGIIVLTEVGRQLSGSVLTAYGYRYEVSWIAVIELLIKIILFVTVFVILAMELIEFIPGIIALAAIATILIHVFFTKWNDIKVVYRAAVTQLVIIIIYILCLLII